MKIVVSHLTRMQEGYFCVAGLDLDSGRHVRPVVPGQRLGTSLLARHGGLFDMGVIIDLGLAIGIGQPPEIEDHAFEPKKARASGTEDPRRFWEQLRRAARPRLRDIFGDALTQRGAASFGVDLGKGAASLGCLVPTGKPALYTRTRPGKHDEIRMRVSDGSLSLDLAVTDIRLFGADHVTPDGEAVNRVVSRLDAGVDVVLSVGLTRFFNGAHWLQLNNVHLADDPLWQLGSPPVSQARRLS